MESNETRNEDETQSSSRLETKSGPEHLGGGGGGSKQVLTTTTASQQQQGSLGSRQRISIAGPSSEGQGAAVDVVPTLKGFILGGSQVGKSALLSRLRGKDPFISAPPPRRVASSSASLNSVDNAGGGTTGTVSTVVSSSASHDSKDVVDNNDHSSKNSKDAVLLPWKAPPQMLSSSNHLRGIENETNHGRAKFLVIDDVPVVLPSSTAESSISADTSDVNDQTSEHDDSSGTNEPKLEVGINFLIGLMDPRSKEDEGKSSIDILEEQIMAVFQQFYALPPTSHSNSSSGHEDEGTSKTFSIHPDNIKTPIPTILLMNFRDCVMAQDSGTNKKEGSGHIISMEEFEKASKQFDLLVIRIERQMSRLHRLYLETLSCIIEEQIRASSSGIENNKDDMNSTTIQEDLINLNVCNGIVSSMLNDLYLNESIGSKAQQHVVWGIHTSMKNCFGLQALHTCLRIPYMTFMEQQYRIHVCNLRHKQWPRNVHSISESIQQNVNPTSYETFVKRLILKKQQQQKRLEQLRLQKLRVQQQTKAEENTTNTATVPIEATKQHPSTFIGKTSEDSQEQQRANTQPMEDTNSTSQTEDTSTLALQREKLELQAKLERLRKLQGSSSATSQNTLQQQQQQQHHAEEPPPQRREILPQQPQSSSHSSSKERKKSKRKNTKKSSKAEQQDEGASTSVNRHDTMSAFSRVPSAAKTTNHAAPHHRAHNSEILQQPQRPSSRNSYDGHPYFSHQNRMVAGPGDSSSTTVYHQEPSSNKKVKAPYDPQSPINIQKQMEARRRQKEIEKQQQQQYLQQRAFSKTMDAQKALDLFLADDESASDDNNNQGAAQSRTTRVAPKLQPKQHHHHVRNNHDSRYNHHPKDDSDNSVSSNSSSSSEEDVFYDEQGNRLHAKHQRQFPSYPISNILRQQPTADVLPKPVPVVARKDLTTALTKQPAAPLKAEAGSETSDDSDNHGNSSHPSNGQLARKEFKNEQEVQHSDTDEEEGKPIPKNMKNDDRNNRNSRSSLTPELNETPMEKESLNNLRPNAIAAGNVAVLSDNDSEDDERFVIKEEPSNTPSPLQKQNYSFSNDSDKSDNRGVEEGDFPIEKEPIVASKKYHRVESPACYPSNEILNKGSTEGSTMSNNSFQASVSSPTRSEAVMNAIAAAEANAKKIALESQATLTSTNSNVSGGEVQSNKVSHSSETKKKKKKKKESDHQESSAADKAAKKERKEKKKKKKEKREAVTTNSG